MERYFAPYKSKPASYKHRSAVLKKCWYYDVKTVAEHTN